MSTSKPKDQKGKAVPGAVSEIIGSAVGDAVLRHHAQGIAEALSAAKAMERTLCLRAWMFTVGRGRETLKQAKFQATCSVYPTPKL